MDTNIAKCFYDTRGTFKMAEQVYKTQCNVIRKSLVKLLPVSDDEDGITAMEISELCGLDPRDIARLLRKYRYGMKDVTRTYVMLKDDGTVDYNSKIVKTYKVNTYHNS